MAPAQEPKTGEKRGPGRPPKSATPAAKKQKIAAPTPTTLSSPAPRSPAVDSPAPDKKAPRLPAKVVDNKPLPTLSDPQSVTVSNDEYQSIASSAVLVTSLERSKTKWIMEGVFQKYWVRPDIPKAGKTPKPLPPGNPEGKWQKHKGECRIRIEPHMFVAEVYVEEKPKPAQPKQYVQNQAYRPQQQPYGQQNQQFQNRTLPQPAQNGTPLAPLQQQQPRAQAAVSPAPGQQDKKASADPVISMLANRASSDMELKALMKEVATGNANPEQLKIFQRHIDELGVIIEKQKKDQEQQANNIQYDGPADVKPQMSAQQTPQPIRPQQPQTPVPQPYTAPQPPLPVPAPAPNYHNQQPTWTPPPQPTRLPVVLQFTTQGASEDRWLFPENSVLEPLSPQHLLVSFMLVKKGRDAADTTGLELDKEYWQAMTMMIEVAYGREEIMNCIRRWVKPADEVRKYMEETMKRCQRAPENYLALRLPFKSTAVTESEDVSKEATPVVIEEKPKAKSAAKSTKKAAAPTSKAATPAAKKAETSSHITVASAAKPASGAQTPVAEPKKDDDPTSKTGEAADPEKEGGRPKRATRKSVRINEPS